MTGPAPIRVVIADDDEVVRAGFAALLATRDDIDVVGAAGDGRTAIRVAAAHRPDVVLMDVRMPILDGIAATRRITAAAAPTPRVIVLTTFDLDEYVRRAVRGSQRIPPEGRAGHDAVRRRPGRRPW